jgi:hypothetical protein
MVLEAFNPARLNRKGFKINSRRRVATESALFAQRNPLMLFVIIFAIVESVTSKDGVCNAAAS